MLDLLSDLREVAHNKAMFDLAEHLDDALMIAAREIRASARSDLDADTVHGVGERFHRPASEHEYS